MNRSSSSHNGARPTISPQLVRLVPAQTNPTKPQPDFPQSHHSTLHTTSPRRAPLAIHQHQHQHRPAQPPIGQAALMSFLDTTFRSYAERIQAELMNLRTACTRAMFREQQDKERWRRHCVVFKRERDVARERVRALIVEREAYLGEGRLRAKRPRDEDGQVVSSSSERAGAGDGDDASRDSTPSNSSTTVVAVSDLDPDASDDSNLSPLAYLSPTYLPLPLDIDTDIVPPPPRSRSADPVLYSATKKRDMTAFDVTVTENPGGERRIWAEPAKKRQRKGSTSHSSDSGTSSSSSSSSSTMVEDETTVQGKGACVPGKGTVVQVVGVGEVGVHDNDITHKLNSKAGASESSSCGTSSSSPSPPPLKSTSIPKIELTHVDLMYVPTNGKLVCRACLLHYNKLPQGSRPPLTSFPINAQWEVLRNHCTTQHLAECAEVDQLRPAEVYELRRRLMMRS